MVVGIQYSSQRLGFERLGQRADEITAAKFLKVEVIMRRRFPEPQCIDSLAAVANDWSIVRNSNEGRCTTGDCPQRTAVYFEGAVEFYLHSLVWSRNFPRVGATEPIVGLLLLPAILDRLFENAVFVSKAVPHRRDLHCSHGIKKAGRETSKSSVTQTRVGLLLEQLEPIESLLLDDFLHDLIEQKVRN